MNPYLRKKIEERAAVGDLISSTLERCAAENRDPDEKEKAQLDEWSLRCSALDQDIAQLETRMRANNTFASLVGRIGQQEEQQEQRQQAQREKPKVETRSAGQRFVESEEFKAYKGRGSMVPIEFEGFLEERSAITLETLGDLLQTQVVSGPSTPPVLTPLLDAITRIPVSSNSVSYIKWGLPPEAGGPIAEGELKPEALIEPTPWEGALDTYAHWKAITRQALEDYAQIRAIVEGQLRAGLLRKIESVGGGVLANAELPSRTETDLLAGIRRAIADLQTIGMAPNAVGVNPLDYAEMDIDAATASNSGPTQFGPFWGLRPIPVPSIVKGQAVVGDFATAIQWYDRNTTGVYMTDSHADFFLRNLLVVLAEQRGKIDVVDPTALVRVTTPEGEDAAAAAAAAKASSKKAAAA